MSEKISFATSRFSIDALRVSIVALLLNTVRRVYPGYDGQDDRQARLLKEEWTTVSTPGFRAQSFIPSSRPYQHITTEKSIVFLP